MVEAPQWWVRCVDDTRLRLARATLECDIAERDLVIVRDDPDVRRPARVIGACPSGTAGQGPALSIEHRISIDPGGETPLSAFVECEADGESFTGHRWGALGAPVGPETPVTTSSERSDVELAFTSSGYREVRNERIHQIVPGDALRFDGDRVTVTAIDRRNNLIELASVSNQEAVRLALDEFIRRESPE